MFRKERDSPFADFRTVLLELDYGGLVAALDLHAKCDEETSTPIRGRKRKPVATDPEPPSLEVSSPTPRRTRRPPSSVIAIEARQGVDMVAAVVEFGRPYALLAVTDNQVIVEFDDHAVAASFREHVFENGLRLNMSAQVLLAAAPWKSLAGYHAIVSGRFDLPNVSIVGSSLDGAVADVVNFHRWNLQPREPQARISLAMFGDDVEVFALWQEVPCQFAFFVILEASADCYLKFLSKDSIFYSSKRGAELHGQRIDHTGFLELDADTVVRNTQSRFLVIGAYDPSVYKSAMGVLDQPNTLLPEGFVCAFPALSIDVPPLTLRVPLTLSFRVRQAVGAFLARQAPQAWLPLVHAIQSMFADAEEKEAAAISNLTIGEGGDDSFVTIVGTAALRQKFLVEKEVVEHKIGAHGATNLQYWLFCYKCQTRSPTKPDDKGQGSKLKCPKSLGVSWIHNTVSSPCIRTAL